MKCLDWIIPLYSQVKVWLGNTQWVSSWNAIHVEMKYYRGRNPVQQHLSSEVDDLSFLGGIDFGLYCKPVACLGVVPAMCGVIQHSNTVLSSVLWHDANFVLFKTCLVFQQYICCSFSTILNEDFDTDTWSTPKAKTPTVALLDIFVYRSSW